LNNGGKLCITGRVASFAGDGTNLYDNYLHANKISYATTPSINGVPGDPIGDGLSMPYGSGGHQIQPDSSGLATKILTMNDGAGCGLKINSTTYKAVYLSFTYGWLVNAGDRTIVLDRIITWLSSHNTLCGDANNDDSIDISDAVYLIQYIFAGGPAPNPLCSGDANGDGSVDISDCVYLIQYIFGGGPAPVPNCCG
jgi:hypothetical protein